MDREILGFIFWAIFGCVMVGIGISGFFQKKPVGFWSNIKTFEVKDVKKYNYATGKLFIVYGIIFILLGLPILGGQNSPYILLSVLGTLIESIVLMAIYSFVIEPKYRKK